MKSPFKQIRDMKQKRDDRPKEYTIPFGEQDPMDIISYSGMEEQKDYLVIGSRYIRVLFINGYPFEAEVGWLDSLNNFAHNADIKQQIEEVNTNEALKKLKRKITELESRKQGKLNSNSIVGPDIEDPLTSAKEMFAAIKRGQEKLFHVSVSVALSADSPEALNEVTQMLLATMSSRLFYMKVATYQQADGLQTILPRGENVLNQRRNLNTTTAAFMFPFMSTELVHDSGIVYGINKKSKSLVIVDRFKLHNANSIVFAQSGAGKSYATKVEILRQLTQRTKVIVIDPEREYENLTQSVNGTYIKLSAKSDQKINPFDLSTTARNKDDISEHIQDLIQVISLMVGGLDDQEMAGVDKAIVAIYAEAKKKPPLLANFYEKLYEQGHHKLCERLEKYTKGSLTDILDSHTNIKMDNRLVVFDIKDLPETLRQIMMMIIANFVQNQVKANPEKRMLVIDEGWRLLEHEQSARFVANLFRRARKFYLAVTIISQQANDFLDNKHGRVIAANASMRILMRQDTTTIDKVAEYFKLSDEEQSYLLACDRGDALIIADQDHVALHVKAAKEEHPLITTDPSETLKP